MPCSCCFLFIKCKNRNSAKNGLFLEEPHNFFLPKNHFFLLISRKGLVISPQTVWLQLVLEQQDLFLLQLMA